MCETTAEDPIDAVITWVDGAAPAHRAARARYMRDGGKLLHENATNPHRWESSDEIYFCLASIQNHAPWVRIIWIVVDGAPPDVSDLSATLRDKIRIVPHAQIFADYGEALPTFNSLAIESVLWRIPDLSERFLYFNDDVFLTAPVHPQDFFEDDRVLLRGVWCDYGTLARDPAARSDPALFNHFMQINAAAMCGGRPDHVFASAHVVHPMHRSALAHLFGVHRVAFEANLRHRFRDLSQFLPQALHNYHCIGAGLARILGDIDHLHITSGQGRDRAPDATRALLQPDALAGIKVVCVNDLPQLEALVPEVRALLARAVGGLSQEA